LNIRNLVQAHLSLISFMQQLWQKLLKEDMNTVTAIKMVLQDSISIKLRELQKPNLSRTRFKERKTAK